MQKKTYVIAAAAVAAMMPVFALTALAQSNGSTGPTGHGRGGFRGGMMQGRGAPGVFGSVTAVSGSTLTVTSKGFGQAAATTTYTVEAGSAKIDKNGATAALSDIAVGDMVRIDGAVSGSNVAATAVHDGIGRPGMMKPDEANPGAAIQGDGQPVIMGTVSAVSGTSLTITNNGSASYSVDASSAKITKAGKSATAGDIAVGDRLVVQGAVSGTSIAATSVIDQAAVRPATTSNGAAHGSTGGAHPGVFSRIYGFFAHLFGF